MPKQTNFTKLLAALLGLASVVAASDASWARGKQPTRSKAGSRASKDAAEAEVADEQSDEAAEAEAKAGQANAESPSGTEAAEGEQLAGRRQSAGAGPRRSNKMEFDARLVRGETAGSGAVVLFTRGQRTLPALTKRRSRFISPTIAEVYGKRHPLTLAAQTGTPPTPARPAARAKPSRSGDTTRKPGDAAGSSAEAAAERSGSQQPEEDESKKGEGRKGTNAAASEEGSQPSKSKKRSKRSRNKPKKK